MKRLPPIVSLLFAFPITTAAAAESTRAGEEPPAPRLEIHFRAQGWYQFVEDGSPDGAGDLKTSSCGGPTCRSPAVRRRGSVSSPTSPPTGSARRASDRYPGKVGRDDGVVVWGNVAGKRLQYRLGLAEGVEGAGNPSDAPRLSGRVALSLLEPETRWFNSGTYLGSKRVLSLGLGFDRQPDLTLAGLLDEDYSAWTVDLFLDHPVGRGAWTVETAYIESRDTPGAVNFTHLTSGDDHQGAYLQTGYLLPPWGKPGRLQVYARHERLGVEAKPDTSFTSLGFNYLLHGHDGKLTLDWTRVQQQEPEPGAGLHRNLITLQVAVGL